ncbi:MULTISPECIES: class I adenylate-forming enzyme family protein [Micromonospora]|uniref:AMP-dependent synthetase n=1 Tax=Micromonospora chalcea TaxID=1874 RepID=A0ABX9Y2S4_MICCH|nr:MULTISPECIES: fatty acid--CoA ligase family protein [Micromonospora]ODB78597.1 AMP-dependent synthetase [Micromonospora sp. II]RQW90507.1 AMP-dependent synthetase [Micromonospora chalcea]RQX33797.1 AMP-dependent synthetase [Micromonospora chalcea]
MPAEVWPQPVLDLLATGDDRPVFEDGDRRVTTAQMYRLVRRIAAGLRAAGAGPGVGVALRLGVTAEAFAAIIAAFAVGARVSGIRPDLTPAHSAWQLGENTLLVDDARVAELAGTPDDGRPLIAAGRPDDVARIVWTSGSTGSPKGCAQTYAAMSAAWAPYPDRWPPAIADLATRLQRYLVFGSLSSQVMLEYGILTLAAGGTLVAARPPGFPGMIARHRATASVITVGKLYQLVRDQRADPVDLSSLRALLVSGSPLPPGRLAEALDVLGPVVFHGYGQTETGMITMVTPAEMLASPAALASVGRPPAVTALSIRDADGRPATEGELFVRTPAQATAYWGDPAETADVFVDGWVRTRDLARLAGDGYLHLLGRIRDVIIVHANLVYAGPIERVLAADPTVAEAYVVGRPDDVTGEAVHAYVVPAAGHDIDAGRLRAVVTEALGDSSAPKTIQAIERVPVAASGKPDKRALAYPAPT